MYETINASEAEREGLKKVTQYYKKFVADAGPAQSQCKQFTTDPVNLFIAAARTRPSARKAIETVAEKAKAAAEAAGELPPELGELLPLKKMSRIIEKASSLIRRPAATDDNACATTQLSFADRDAPRALPRQGRQSVRHRARYVRLPHHEMGG